MNQDTIQQITVIAILNGRDLDTIYYQMNGSAGFYRLEKLDQNAVALLLKGLEKKSLLNES